MTPLAPSPHGSPGSSTRVRVKWDNVMIVLIGVVVAAFAVVGILLYSDSGTAPTPAKDPSTATAAESGLTDVATEAVEPGALSLDDSIGVVEEVRAFMAEGRWVEAADRLDLIPTDLRDASGATEAQELLDERRGAHDQLRAELEAAIEARNWKGAQTVIAKLAELAPLDADLTATKELVDTALTPKRKGANAGSKESTTATSTGGGGSESSTSGSTKPAAGSNARPASNTKPASTKPKPASSGARPTSGTPRPTATGGGSSTAGAATGGTSVGSSSTTGSSTGVSAGSSTGTGSATATGGSTTGTSGATAGTGGAIAGIGSASSLGDLGINLTPQQEADLEQALEQALAGL